MKKLLMLGGSPSQVVAIKKAKEMGYYVITCDYLEHNPGHQFADEYYNVSTIDKEAVFTLAKSLNIDGVLCYAADSGAPTAAYVAEKLGLPSFPYRSVEILSNKDMFRSFLKKNNFNVPQAKGYTTLEEAKADFHTFTMPAMIKPVDSSGSRGVSLVESVELLEEKVEAALYFSRAKRFIMEEYINKQGYQIGGDCFVVNGKLVFTRLVNNHFEANLMHSFLPIGESWPCILPTHVQHKITCELQRLIDLLNMETGPLIFEAQMDTKGRIYFIDIGVRNNGDLTQAIKQIDGVNLVEYTIKAAVGEDCSNLGEDEPGGYWGVYTIVNEQAGGFKKIQIEQDVSSNNLVKSNIINIPLGYKIDKNATLGTLLLTFSSMAEMLEKMDNMKSLVRVDIEASNIVNGA
ncbi:ATP-grasp domain-containing protein [Lysinibacillus sp. KU-BSD001]|uniref:ATP-grasp domain-containing protein n=1 Tax=Lysinibacillus sp. KU-BSD001 TaxID=3141328 RepID=UPI0036E73B6C